jgi:hypothetical protein
MKRVHIVGSGPRTGTTLLAELMAVCFHIDHSCKHESPICTDQPKEGNCLLTKQPGDFASVGLPLLLNPQLYVVCIIRDPRDSIVSFHGSRPGVYWTGLRYWKLFVNKYDKLAKHPHFVLIRYEDLVSNPDGIQKELMVKIPFLEKKHRFSEFHLVAKPSESSLKALRKVRPIERKGIGRWRNHLPRIKQQILIHGSISEELIKFGYEPDISWEQVLDGIEKDDCITARPEFLRFRDLIKHKKREMKESINIIIRSLGLSPEKFLAPSVKVYAISRSMLRLILKPSFEFFRKK